MAYNLDDYAIFPREFLNEGTLLTVHLYVHLQSNKTLLLFRKPGDKITAEDIESFRKIPDDKLLYPSAEQKKIYEMGAQALAMDIAAGNPSSSTVKAVAATVLDTLAPTTDLNECLHQASAMVRILLQEFKEAATFRAYDEILKQGAAKQQDALTLHHQQVSTLSVLMAMTAGNFSMADFSDLALAGLIHDLGLRETTKHLADSHTSGLCKLMNQEKIVYMRHIEQTLDSVRKQKIPITPGVQRIIEHHHENWNGSGFRGLAGVKIYRSARVLRLADDVVSIVQGSNYQKGFQDALDILEKETGAHDPDILQSLRATATGRRPPPPPVKK